MKHEADSLMTSAAREMCYAMRDEVTSCLARSLQELKYRILFPADDIVTRSILGAAPQTWYEALLWPEKHDRVTRALYPEFTGELKYYPYLKDIKKPDKDVYIGILGDQHGNHHWETIREHALLVTAKLTGEDERLSKLNVVLGVLHDIGKKYTAASNKSGDLCFYNHEALSAYIAGLWLRQNPSLFTDDVDDIWPVVAAIYLHMFYRLYPGRHDAQRRMCEQLRPFFADNQRDVLVVIALVDLLDWADVGCETPESLRHLWTPKLHLIEKQIDAM